MPATITSPLLVGRDTALLTLTRAITDAAAGAPRFVVVRGEAGIGKSRLVREAGASLPDGTLVLTGDCLDIGMGGLPYLPIVEAFRRFARTSDRATVEQIFGHTDGNLGLLFPESVDARGPDRSASPSDPGVVPSPAGLSSGLAQARLFELVLDRLGALSAPGGAVLVIEDVHWIDRATRDLLTFLARNLTDERLAVVLTVREGDLPRSHPILVWLAELERSRETVTVELDRLDRVDVERQLRLIAGDDLAPGVADHIWHRSDGNPMFVEELYAGPAGAADGPRQLVEALRARVGRLDPLGRTVVEAAAVAARPVDERLLAEVLAIDEAELDQPIRGAIAHGVLALDPATERYGFRHELLREVVERELTPGARRRLHERFARRLEAHPELADTSRAGAAGELAVHFAEAGLAPEAYAHSITAADGAEAVHAYADAHRHLERALDLEARLAGAVADRAGQVALRGRAADDADLAGDFERALELTRAALELVDASCDPVTAGLLHSRIGYLRWSLGDGRGVLASHEEAVRLVPAEPASPERAKVLGSLGGALMSLGRWQESRVICEGAIACAVAAGATAEESRARNMLGSDLVALGESEAGIAELREACRTARLAGRVDMVIVGHYNLSLNLVAVDRLDEALAEARAGLTAAREAGLERRFGQDLAALIGDVFARLGRIDEADTAVASGLALDPRGRGTVYLSTVRGRLAGIRGDVAETMRRRAEVDLTTQDPDVAAYVAAVAAEALTWADRPDEAAAEAEAGLAAYQGLDETQWCAPLTALGLRAAADMAETARARRPGASAADLDRLVAGLRARLDRLARRVTTTSGRGWIALARGELARATGSQDADAWRDAVMAFDAVPEPLTAAYARLRAAEAELQARGLRGQVVELLAEATAIAERTGAQPLAAALATLAARARIAMPQRSTAQATTTVVVPATPPAADPRAAAMALGLSSREVEVLELVTHGLTNGEIAERLFITRKTAAVHVTHILDKLGVANRVGAAMIGARAGLGSLDQEDSRASE
ncbi:MAG TPA: AAA family ATPase [Candidatus Limnocylindrales bacterium]|nr:AAA family ATPase [Candidatus Limnocylindrales bacterium]